MLEYQTVIAETLSDHAQALLLTRIENLLRKTHVVVHLSAVRQEGGEVGPGSHFSFGKLQGKGP
ncbi:hypothetical protein D3C86_1790180 [compost metagenome]